MLRLYYVLLCISIRLLFSNKENNLMWEISSYGCGPVQRIFFSYSVYTLLLVVHMGELFLLIVMFRTVINHIGFFSIIQKFYRIMRDTCFGIFLHENECVLCRIYSVVCCINISFSNKENYFIE